jgi:putative nucleotidyltransferase with HDIG domain
VAAGNKTKKSGPGVNAKAAGKVLISRLRRKADLMELELGIYREIGGLAVKGSSRSSILSRLMDFALKAVGCGAGALYLLDPATGELTKEVAKGSTSRRPRGLKESAGSGIVDKVARTGKPFITNPGNGKNRPEKKRSSASKSTLAVPLLRKKKVIGVIEVTNKAGKTPFTTEDQNILISLANHFSIIMERANLFSELDDRIKQFSTLHEVGSLLISTLDQGVVRRRAMEAITRLMHAETGSLLLLDEKTRELYFEVALGVKGKKLKEVRLGMGEGIAGWVAKHGRSLIIPDVTKDKRFLGKIDEHSKFQTRSMICVPVRIKDKVIGVLQAINRIGAGTFTREDLRVFQLFSNQVAIALDNARLYEEIKETFYATSEALAEAIETRDPYTGGHTKRVLEYSMAIAKELKLNSGVMEILKLSAVLHDIGKIGIEDSILRKDAPLDVDEADTMKAHPQLGVEILKHVPQLKDVIPGMLHHHERVDGLGYPRGFKGGRIPLIAKIISVADTYDAITTTRPYRKGLPPRAALKEIKKYSGKQFDGKVVDAFIKAFKNGTVSGINTT